MKGRLFCYSCKQGKAARQGPTGVAGVRVPSGSWKGQLLQDRQLRVVRFPELCINWLIEIISQAQGLSPVVWCLVLGKLEWMFSGPVCGCSTGEVGKDVKSSVTKITRALYAVS